MRIDVCVCTYRRDSLIDCLATVAAQTIRSDADVRIVVADNNDAPIMERAVRDAEARLAIPIAYVHAPARNISVARNACLDAATGDWVVFIDDDESAMPDWLDRLMARADGHDVVFGVSRAMLSENAPKWMRSGQFHSNSISGNDKPHNGYTCNVAMRRSAIADLRFSLPLGTTGGEDTLFFEEANEKGLRFAYAPDAIVVEEIPDSRANLRWLLRRRFRSGQTHHLLLQRQRKRGAGVVVLASAKLTACLAAAAVHFYSPVRAASHLARGWFHLGVVAAAFGSADVQEYASPPAQG